MYAITRSYQFESGRGRKGWRERSLEGLDGGKKWKGESDLLYFN